MGYLCLGVLALPQAGNANNVEQKNEERYEKLDEPIVGNEPGRNGGGAGQR